MYRLIVISCVVAACAAQNFGVDNKAAKILKEQRYNSGDGRAGTAYATENGHVFREETDINGDRIGQYSYVGDDGKTYSVKYSAGKGGFRILSGDHIRATGQDAAPFDPNYSEVDPNNALLSDNSFAPSSSPQSFAPSSSQSFNSFPTSSGSNFQQNSFQPQQQQPFQPQPDIRPAQFTFDDLNNNNNAKPASNPFINPHDPSHRNFKVNVLGSKFEKKSHQQHGSGAVPACADCEGVNPFINPFDSSHQAQANNLFQVPSPQPQPQQQPSSFFSNQQPSGLFADQPQQTFQSTSSFTPSSSFNGIPSTTPAPRRQFPQGQLKLNRFNSGFNFDFSS